MRERLAAVALSELVGLGLVDRLWADRTVRAIFVNGPKAVFVERNGRVQAAGEVFRDEGHLVALLGRLVARPARGVAEFTLRDGGVGAVIFPPAAPTGPVLMLRRGEPGTATLERLVRSGMLAPAIADLLPIAARSGLHILVSGPEGSGKAARPAAIARHRDGLARAVSLEDANGQPVFVHDDGAFRRRAAAPAFASILQAKGYGEALSRIIR